VSSLQLQREVASMIQSEIDRSSWAFVLNLRKEYMILLCCYGRGCNYDEANLFRRSIKIRGNLLGFDTRDSALAC